MPDAEQADRPTRVLLVEDDPAYAELVRRLLADALYGRLELVHVQRLADARERLREGPADCVLLDLGLPDAQGLEAVLQVRDAAPDVPIVVLSGQDDEAIALRAVQEGAQDYLSKARIDHEGIGRAIRYSIERKRAEGERARRLREQAARAQAEAIAETLQRSFLPERLPEFPGVSLAARYIPGTAGVEVGGDWYDVFVLTGGHLGVAMGDVVGRGVGAASLMGQLRNALRAYAFEGHEPAAVAERLNRLVQSLNPGQIATVVYLVLEPDTRTVRFTSAGHLPPLLVAPDGAAAFLETGGSPPLGAAAYVPYRESHVTLEPGSTLVVYTDGLVERREEALDEGLERLRRTAAGEPGDPGDPEALCDRVVGELLGDGPAADDAALLVVRDVPLLDERLQLRLPAEPEALSSLRRTLARWLNEAEAGAEESYDLTVACGEACANAIEHAYPPGDAEFEVELAREDGEVTVTVRDFGRWRAARGAHRGRGLELMEALVDSVDVTQGPDGTTVRLRHSLRRGRRS